MSFIESEVNFQIDLDQIDSLQRRFDSSVKSSKAKNKPISSYNPVVSRWRAENSVEKNEFKETELIQIRTMLAERLRVGNEPVYYQIKEDGARHEGFPSEPFGDILERGRLYRQSEGSNEQERETSEVLGFKELFARISDPKTKPGTKIAVISAPGLTENSSYPHNFVDVYKKVNEKLVEMTRYYSDMNYEEYLTVIRNIDPSYFDGFSGPLDAWLLRHPVNGFEKVFKEGKTSMSINEFRSLFEVCMPVIQYYLDTLCQENYDPQRLAIAFNAVLNEVDIQRERLSRKSNVLSEDRRRYLDIAQKVAYLGRLKVRETLAGCGLSGGFEIGEIPLNRSFVDVFANSVAQFGVDDGKGPLRFKCQNGHWNTREPHKFKKYCRTCSCDMSCKKDE